ncbi:MAG: hypothetical protein DWI23_01570 [Planctomycetota bacterium]|nr:MAG: hypothetical protein DWI23_01570 [Planctomycetota bacterium]
MFLQFSKNSTPPTGPKPLALDSTSESLKHPPTGLQTCPNKHQQSQPCQTLSQQSRVRKRFTREESMRHRGRYLCESLLWLGTVASFFLPSPATAKGPAVLDPRYGLELFASQPDIVTPIGATFDARGRLLVIESHTHFTPEDYAGPKHDRLRIIEDTDGDGRADRFRTFFDGMQFAMGVRRGPDDWIYVVTRNEVFRIRDADGDDVAEIREPIVRLKTDGNYPHNGLGGLAFDGQGRLCFGLGENLGAAYTLVAADGSTWHGGGEGGSLFRCTSHGAQLERLATGFWNPFGLCFDPAGRMFAVDNDPDSRPPCRLLNVVPTGDYGYQFRYGRSGKHPLQAWDGELPGTLSMASGTGEAPCAVLAFDGGLWVTSWGSNRLERFSLTPMGATCKARFAIAVQGDHLFRPVDFALASDGSLFFTDWVNRSYPVHGQGRIWRLHVKSPAAADAIPATWPELSIAEHAARQMAEGMTDGPMPSQAALVSALSDEDPFYRQAAVARLVALGQAKLPTVASLTEPLARVSVVVAHRWLAANGSISEKGRIAAEAIVRQSLNDTDERVKLLAIRWIADFRMDVFRPALEQLAATDSTSPRLFSAVFAARSWLDGGSNGDRAAEDRRLRNVWENASKPVSLRATALKLMPVNSPLLDAELLARIVRLDSAVDSGADSAGRLQGNQSPLAREASHLLALRTGGDAAAILSVIATDQTLPPERRADAVAGLAQFAKQHSHTLATAANDPDPIVAREARRIAPPKGSKANAAETGSNTSDRPSVFDTEAWLTRLGPHGNAEAGWRVFFSQAGGKCATCHMLDGRGANIGPDLTGIVARMGRRRVLQSLLEPSREIGPGYQAYALHLVDGRVLNGLSLGLTDEAQKERFVEPDGRETAVAVDTIESRVPLTTSIMPQGLEQDLTDDDLRDLLALLGE